MRLSRRFMSLGSICLFSIMSLAISSCGSGSSSGGSSGGNPSPKGPEFIFGFAQSGSGIQPFKIDLGSGILSQLNQIPVADAGMLTVTPSGRFLYVIVEGGINAYSVGSGGSLSLLSGSPSAPPKGAIMMSPFPNSLTVNPQGTALYALYNSEDATSESFLSLVEFQLDSATGALTAVPNVMAWGTDSGAPTFDPSGQFMYDLAGITTVTGSAIEGFSINSSSGTIQPIVNSPFAVSSVNQNSQVAIDPTGHFLYAPLTTKNAIAGFTRDLATGELTQMAGSPFVTDSSQSFWGISFCIHPSGKFLYAFTEGDGMVSAFTIDSGSGVLSPVTGSPYPAQLPPAGGMIAVDPSGAYLYESTYTNEFVIYDVNQTTGTLNVANGSPQEMGVPIGPFTIFRAP